MGIWKRLTKIPLGTNPDVRYPVNRDVPISPIDNSKKAFGRRFLSTHKKVR